MFAIKSWTAFCNVLETSFQKLFHRAPNPLCHPTHHNRPNLQLGFLSMAPELLTNKSGKIYTGQELLEAARLHYHKGITKEQFVEVCEAICSPEILMLHNSGDIRWLGHGHEHSQLPKWSKVFIGWVFDRLIDTLLIIYTALLVLDTCNRVSISGTDFHQYSSNYFFNVAMLVISYILTAEAVGRVYMGSLLPGGWRRVVQESHGVLFIASYSAMITQAETSFFFFHYSNGIWFRYVTILRVIRPFRLLIRWTPVGIVMTALKRLVPSISRIVMFIILLMMFFAEIGTFLFYGLLREDNPRLKGSDWVANSYERNNFDSLLNGMGVLFEQLVVNNWFIVMDACVLAYHGSSLPRVFFISFYIVGVLVSLNVLVAFLIDAWFVEYEQLTGALEEEVWRNAVQRELPEEDDDWVEQDEEITSSLDTTHLENSVKRFISRHDSQIDVDDSKSLKRAVTGSNLDASPELDETVLEILGKEMHSLLETKMIGVFKISVDSREPKHEDDLLNMELDHWGEGDQATLVECLGRSLVRASRFQHHGNDKSHIHALHRPVVRTRTSMYDSSDQQGIDVSPEIALDVPHFTPLGSERGESIEDASAHVNVLNQQERVSLKNKTWDASSAGNSRENSMQNIKADGEGLINSGFPRNVATGSSAGMSSQESDQPITSSTWPADSSNAKNPSNRGGTAESGFDDDPNHFKNKNEYGNRTQSILRVSVPNISVPGSLKRASASSAQRASYVASAGAQSASFIADIVRETSASAYKFQ